MHMYISRQRNGSVIDDGTGGFGIFRPSTLDMHVSSQKCIADIFVVKMPNGTSGIRIL